MENQLYNGFSIGNSVSVYENDEKIISGTVIRIGSKHASIICSSSGVSYDVPYDMMKLSTIGKTAQNNVIKEEESDGKVFKLIKDEKNVDGQITVKYEVLVDDVPIWESEELVTNSYDVEKGWSAPDDFDDNKLDLIKQKAESGFDLVMESYSKIEENIQESVMSIGDTVEGDEETKGEPAFAPGEEPSEPIGGEGVPIEEVVEEEAVEETAEVPGPEATAETPEESTASVENNFSRSILSGKKKEGSELLRNPEHRISPITRKLMKEKGIDSGQTSDIELAEDLKDADWTLSSIKRIESKLKKLNK